MNSDLTKISDFYIKYWEESWRYYTSRITSLKCTMGVSQYGNSDEMPLNTVCESVLLPLITPESTRPKHHYDSGHNLNGGR